MPITLRVLNGQTLTINQGYKPVYADELIMEDNSTILVQGTRVWKFQCPRVVAGMNTRIIATGANGNNGENQTYVPGQAAQCQGGDGRAAQPGGNGTSGADGLDLNFTWGIESIGSLHISTSGGHGGSGGKGGQGQQGGGATCAGCDGQSGGSGGPGGSAGRGGDAGVVVLRWYPLNDAHAGQLRSALQPLHENLRAQTAIEATVFSSVTPVGLQITSDGGARGIRGEGGDPGRGGDGVGCGFYSRGGGAMGWKGDPGGEARDGASNAPVVELIPNPNA